MNSNISNLLKKAGPYPAVLGVTAFLVELGRVYIPQLIQKNSVTIVPAEPIIANLDEDDEITQSDAPVDSDLDETYEYGDVVNEAVSDDEIEGYRAAAAPYQYQASEYAEAVHAMRLLEEAEDPEAVLLELAEPLKVVHHARPEDEGVVLEADSEAAETQRQIQSAVSTEAMLTTVAEARQRVDYSKKSTQNWTVQEVDAAVSAIEDAAPESHNIFRNDDTWDMEFELSKRDPEQPYVISSEEYLENATEYKQETVTYYEGDDTMANVADVPIHHWPKMMGDLRWGHGSLDPNVVYIRNERLHREWEVLLHHGSYEIEVQGLQIEDGELTHRVRKFRDD